MHTKQTWPKAELSETDHSLYCNITHTLTHNIYNYWHSPFISKLLILIQSRAASVSEIQPRLSTNPTIHDLQSWSWKSIRCVSTDSSALDIQMDQVNCVTLKWKFHLKVMTSSSNHTVSFWLAGCFIQSCPKQTTQTRSLFTRRVTNTIYPTLGLQWELLIMTRKKLWTTRQPTAAVTSLDDAFNDEIL